MTANKLKPSRKPSYEPWMLFSAQSIVSLLPPNPKHARQVLKIVESIVDTVDKVAVPSRQQSKST